MKEKGIYLESTTAPGSFAHGKRHLYLVYRDGKGNEHVVRGGPSFLGGGDITTEDGVPMADSKDVYDEGGGSKVRPSHRLDLNGSDPDIVWRQMTAAAKKLGEADVDYNLAPMQNSNSTIRHVLEAAAIDPAKAMGPGWTPRDFPGYNNDLNEPNSDFDRERTGTAGRKRRRDGGSPDFRGLGLVDKVLAALDPREPTPDYAAKGVDDGTRGWREPAVPQAPKAGVGASPKAEDRQSRGQPTTASENALARMAADQSHSAKGDDTLFEARIMQEISTIPALEKLLLKKPHDWTEGERGEVMRDPGYRDKNHPDYSWANDSMLAHFSGVFGDAPAKMDGHGRPIEAAPRQPMRDQPTPIKTADGAPLEEAGARIAQNLARAGATDGPTKAVKTLQANLNKLSEAATNTVQSSTIPDEPFYSGAAKRAAPKPQRLKEDGVFGPKTAKATRSALVRFGEKPVGQAGSGFGADALDFGSASLDEPVFRA
jgi:hypothetical protein